MPGTKGPGAAPRPTVIPPLGKASPLDTAIGMGTDPIENDANDNNDVYDQLVYVIPPMGNNCGGIYNFGAMAIDVGDDMMLDAGDTIVASANTIAVAEGYSELLGKFAAVYGAPADTSDTGTAGRLAAAQKALSTQIENGLTGAALKPAEDAVAAAQKLHDDAMAIYTDAASGPVYQAGVAEWMAKAAVTKSIETYNMRVDDANMAQAALDELDYSKYVSLINDRLLTVVPVTNGMAGTIELMELATYANAIVGQSTVATVNPETGVTTTIVSNFDAAGRLIVPMELDDSTDDVDDDLRAVVDSSDNGVNMIRQRRDDYAVAAAALQKLADDTREATGGASPLQLAYDEAARRANAEANYYNDVYNAMLSDTTMQASNVDDDAATDVDESMTNIATRNAAHVTENNKRFLAEQDLRAKAAAREAATAHVQGSFSNPTAFYDQLVARRQAEKVAADRRVAKASEDGGTAAKSLTDAAAAAQKNLDSATETNNAIQAQFSAEDDPTLALVQELLKNGGDDGKALVDAIAAVYGTATSAVSDAAGVIDELRAPVAANTAAIAGHETRISQNEADIVAIDGRVTQNEADIVAIDGRVTQNEADIVALDGRVTDNAADILMNAGHIAENRGMIETNAAGILMNAGMIAEMGGMIGANTTGIATNRGMIDQNARGVQTLRAGVAASMAMAGMPEIGDRGVSVGAGSYDGETALAVGVHFSGENSRFKIGITSADGETGASVGAGWSF